MDFVPSARAFKATEMAWRETIGRVYYVFLIAASIRLVLRSAARYYQGMNTLTIKIPPQLEQEIVLASEREHLSKSELVRRALVAYVSQRKAGRLNMSALEQAGDLVACFSGGPSDLSSNPRHLDDFGRV